MFWSGLLLPNKMPRFTSLSCVRSYLIYINSYCRSLQFCVSVYESSAQAIFSARSPWALKMSSSSLILVTGLPQDLQVCNNLFVHIDMLLAFFSFLRIFCLWKCGTIALSYPPPPLLLLMTHHEKTRLKALP